MGNLTPFVRHLLLCEDVSQDPNRPGKLSIHGLLTSITKTNGGSDPIVHSFSAFLLFTEGRGTGKGKVVVLQADSGEIIFEGDDHLIKFGDDPLDIHGLVFRVFQCQFPRIGLYYVEFRYNGETIAREPLKVR